MTAALEGGEWSAARSGRTLPPGKSQYPLYRRLGGPQGRSGQAENLAPPGFDPRIRPARIQSLYRLSYPAHIHTHTHTHTQMILCYSYTYNMIVMIFKNFNVLCKSNTCCSQCTTNHSLPPQSLFSDRMIQVITEMHYRAYSVRTCAYLHKMHSNLQGSSNAYGELSEFAQNKE